MSGITIKDIEKHYEAPVWQVGHQYYVWFANCMNHHMRVDLSCVYCRAGYWSGLRNDELEKIQTEVNKTVS